MNVSAATPDYPAATWVPAASANYTVANRPHDYPVDMIVVHDIEGTAAAAISSFQNPARAGSAHYVVGYDGSVTQMVQEKDVAWHAGNWDYNTRAIGIEHAGFACCADYTTAEYDASAHLIASICSRYGVPMDRAHVIGHNEVPDPTNPALGGGIDHHTDPGASWDWTTYISLAQQYAAQLPSPPRLGRYPIASLSGTTATVTWQAARTCHTAVAGYTVTAQPGGVTKQLPASATSTVFSGLHSGTVYTFTVTATNADGSDSLASNVLLPGAKCTSATVHMTSPAPALAGTAVTFGATAASCPVPLFQYSVLFPNGRWYLKQTWTTGAFTWNTVGMTPGRYPVRVWAIKTGDSGATPEAVGYTTVTLTGCTSASVAPPSQTAPVGSTVNVTAAASGCPAPQFEFWEAGPSGRWHVKTAFAADKGWAWDTTGNAPGKYTVRVWANQQGAYTGAAQATGTSTVILTGCTSAALTPATGTVKVGTQVTFKAVASGCPNPVYEFWVQSPHGYWYKQTAFAGDTWTWDCPQCYPGTYTIQVWANSQGASTGRAEAIGASKITLT